MEFLDMLQCDGWECFIYAKFLNLSLIVVMVTTILFVLFNVGKLTKFFVVVL
jgi:hypothetical protein